MYIYIYHSLSVSLSRLYVNRYMHRYMYVYRGSELRGNGLRIESVAVMGLLFVAHGASGSDVGVGAPRGAVTLTDKNVAKDNGDI